MARLALLVFIPISLGLRFLLNAPPLLVFATGAIAVGVLADWVRRATEQIASRAGGAIGGLLNVSFGSIAELVLALFVLTKGETAVVQAQITGSIIGTALLGLGLAILIGGMNRPKQTFNRERIGLQSSMLFLVVIALLLPAVFDATERSILANGNPSAPDERLSISVSIVLLFLYAGNLAYTLVTHRDVFASGDTEERGASEWSTGRALGVLIGATIAIAIEAELVSDALGETATTLGLSPVFLGVIALALVGTSADLFAAVVFARDDRMDLVLSICIGSAIQVALVVAPLLVLLSWVIGHPMNLVFSNQIDLFAIAGTAIVVRAIAADGETTWFEGLLLTGVYILLALAFFFAT